jgi:hypothetical protein
MTTQLLLAAYGVYLVALVATVYLTRATAPRVLGALAGGAAVAVAGVGIEALAHERGWWRYPSVETPYGPPLIYPALLLAFAVLALIGWRVTRRFGWRGQAAYLAAVTIVGTLRDYAIAARLPDLVVIAPGAGLVLVDAALWAGLTALAQAVMRLVAGPAQRDPLARESQRHKSWIVSGE